MRTVQIPEATTVGQPAERVAWNKRHVLDLDEFSRQEMEAVLDTSSAMKDVLHRDIKKVPTLRGKSILTLFYESSTRTRVSFEQAGKVLSADVINISSGTSSAAKGESLLDTLLTLQSMAADVIVIRHPSSGAPYLAARHLGHASVVNAGDGTHAHPTQALLDAFTIREKRGRLEGLRVAIVGDVAHSRVARSNLWGLTRMGAHVVLCGPPTLMPWDLLKGRETTPGHPFGAVEVELDLEKALPDADVIMALRLQKERQQMGAIPSLREYARLWQVNTERLALCRPDVLLMHPGPMNEGVEISPEAAHGPHSVVQEQVTNGVAVRMALLYLLCGPAESS
ncbi:MAG: aspartate carbamoyltransferase catalytic subunit [Chloroflexi bacterium]|nr:aspartate carbamoyltransferase catalytic subunit [Chloroflexota bacterium]